MHAPRYKQLSSWISAAVALAVVLAVFSSVALTPPSTSAQTTEPDNDTDAYDQTTCGGVEEDDVPDVSHTGVVDPGGKIDMDGGSSQDLGNDSDEYSPFPKNNFWPSFDVSNTDSSVSFEPNYTAEDDELANDSFISEPAVSFTQTGNAVPGQEATVVIQATNFSGQEAAANELYFASWLDGLYFNGQLAGGDEEAYDQQTNSASDAARPDCGTIGRTTTTDNDGDGMDDAWELRHGLNPGNAGDAGEDPDGDGYLADDFPNADGELLSPVPAIAGGELGDGFFTNIEEYILGTNPNDPDSDADGYVDEQDAVGLAQNVVTFTARKSPADGPYLLHSIVVGFLEKQDAELVRLTKVDSSEFVLLQHGGEELDVDLRVVNPGVRAGETLEVQALPRGSSTPDLLASYRWSVDGVPQTDLSGTSRRTLRYVVPDGTRPGTTFVVGVEAIDPKNGQLARGRASVTVGDTVLLSYNPELADIGSTVEIQALLSGGLDPAEHLFLWRVDGDDQRDASRIGADVLTWSPSVSAGDEQLVSVRILDRRSKQVGEVEQEVRVNTPSVQVELTPAAPTADQQVLARAATSHFGSTTLAYDFSVDGQAVPSAGPTATFSAGSAGSSHTVSVTVRTVDTSPTSASASVSFTTLGSLAFGTTDGDIGRQLLAQAIGAQQGAGFAALTAVVAIGLGVTLARRTRRSSWGSA